MKNLNKTQLLFFIKLILEDKVILVLHLWIIILNGLEFLLIEMIIKV